MKNITIRIITTMLLCSTFNSYTSQSDQAIVISQQKFPMVTLPKDIFNQCTTIGHNRKILLLQFPHKVFENIFGSFINANHPIYNNVRKSLRLGLVCKDFYNLLPVFGKLNSDHSDKAQIMGDLQYSIYDDYGYSYADKRRTLLLLLHAQAPYGTDPECPIVETIIRKNDTEVASLLFQCGANPNEKNKHLSEPIIFSIESKAMIRLFNANGANWHARYKNRSILHVKSDILYPTQKDTKILETLLLLVPNLINTLSNSGLTALDYAQLNQEHVKGDEEKKQKEAFIALLRKYGALTADELKQKNETRITKNISFLKTTNLR